MSKRIGIVVLCVILLVGAAIAYVAVSKSPVAMTDMSSTKQTPESLPKADATTEPSVKGTYASYSPTALANSTGTDLLFFHAPWCPQCRALESSINAASLPDGVTIFKVDYDTNQALRQKYGVTLQTTVVRVDDEGNMVEKYVAYDEPTFASVKKNLLD